MKLLAIRDLNVQDPLSTLGRKIEPLAKPVASGSRPTEHPSVFEKPDGKLETWIPENEWAAWEGPERRGKSIYNYFEQAAYEGKDYFEQNYMPKPYEQMQDSFVYEGARTGRTPSAPPAHGAPYIRPGSNLNGKRPQMMVPDGLASTDFSGLEKRILAAWYAKYKELGK